MKHEIDENILKETVTLVVEIFERNNIPKLMAACAMLAILQILKKEGLDISIEMRIEPASEGN